MFYLYGTISKNETNLYIVYSPKYLNLMIPIDISARAIEEIKQTMAQKNIPPAYGLRIGVRGGGCAGRLGALHH